MGSPKSFAELRANVDSLDTIWMDGEFVDWDEATIHVLTHGLHYGTGVFEGVRCYDTTEGPMIFRWDEHLERLYQSAQPYDIEIPYTRAELTEAAMHLIRSQESNSCYIRPLVFYGYDRLGLNPEGIPIQTAIAVWPMDAYLGEEALKNGVDVTVSSWRRYSSSQIPTTAKTTGPYVNSMLANLEARRNGYDEAILLNNEGNVAEGPAENLFLVSDGEVFTPGLAEGVLPGITRDSIIQLARDSGYLVHDEATISRGQLHTADELFFVGTAAEVTPIRRVENVRIGTGTKGPITDEIQSRFFDIVERRVEDYGEWFTPVTRQVTQHP